MKERTKNFMGLTPQECLDLAQSASSLAWSIISVLRPGPDEDTKLISMLLAAKTQLNKS